MRPRGLSERIRAAVELYPCDLLFIHRDAEGEPPPRMRNRDGRLQPFERSGAELRRKPRRGCAERAAFCAAVQVAVEERLLELGQPSVELG